MSENKHKQNINFPEELKKEEKKGPEALTNQHTQKINYAVLTWGPCVARMQISEEFHKLLLEEAHESQQESLLFQHRLAGIIQKEYQFRDISKMQPYLTDIVKVYDQVWDKWRNAEQRSVNKYLIRSMWVNYQRKNEFNPPHDHSDDLSFVIYLKVPEEIKTEFNNYKGKSSGPGGISFIYGEGNRQAITYQAHFPKERDLFIFPAWLKHYVAPFKADVERISVSGNLASQIPFTTLEPVKQDKMQTVNNEKTKEKPKT